MTSVSVANVEFDAAQALLDLQSNVRENNTEQRDDDDDHKEDMEKSATFFLSCFLKPIHNNTAIQTFKKYPAEKSGAKDLRVKRTLKRKYNTDNDYLNDSRTTQCNDHYSNIHPKILESNSNNYSIQSLIDKNTTFEIQTQQTVNNYEKSNSRDMGTQTEEIYDMEIVKTMERTIEKLYEKIHSLEEQITANAELLNSIEQDISDDDLDLADVDDVSYESKADNYMTMNGSHISNSDEEEQIKKSASIAGSRGHDPDYKLEQESKSKKVLRNSSLNANANDMIPIGDGNAMIPSRIYRHINWNSYTSATRKLLTAVFSRKVLATHSLTGKPSPAFPNKPAKKKLDSSLVNDIVQAVVENCNVPENVVRTSITTKCADESKMFRTRQQNKKKRKYKLNNENIPPESESDDV